MRYQEGLRRQVGAAGPCFWVWVLLAALLAGCGVSEEDKIPPEIYGHWVTNAKGYEDCAMDITESTISFYTTMGTTDVNFIDKIVRTEKEKKIVYDIHYVNSEGSEFILSVSILEGGKKSRLQFHNQKYLTWNKVEWLK